MAKTINCLHINFEIFHFEYWQLQSENKRKETDLLFE